MQRRDFLRTSAEVTVGVGTLSAAGCSQVPVVGSDDGNTREQWLHAPGTVRDVNHYEMYVVKPDQILANREAFESDEVRSFVDNFDARLSSRGLDIDELDRIIDTNAGTVYSGGVSKTDVTDKLEDQDINKQTEVGGFGIYRRGNEPVAYAVGSNALVEAFPSGDKSAEDVAELIVEVSNGQEARYGEENEAMSILQNTLSDGYYRTAETYEKNYEGARGFGHLEDSVGFGSGSSFDGDAIQVEYVVAYENQSDVDVDKLESYITEIREPGGLSTLENISYSSDGRAGVIRAQRDPSEVIFPW